MVLRWQFETAFEPGGGNSDSYCKKIFFINKSVKKHLTKELVGANICKG